MKAEGIKSQPVIKKINPPDKFKKFIKSGKFKGIIFLLAVGSGYYFYYQKNNVVVPNSYILDSVSRGAIISNISGTGQISSLNQLDIKPKVSADILELKVQSGQKVKEGEILTILDSSDLTTQVKNAKNSLDIARTNLNLKISGLSPEEIIVAQRSVDSAKLSYNNSLINLENAKKDAEANLQTAQLQLSDSQASLDNAQKTYDNAISSNNLSSNSDLQDLNNTYSSARSTLSSAQITIRSTVVFADNLLGYNHYNNNINSYQSLLGARNFQSLSDAQIAFIKTESEMKEFEKYYDLLINSEKQSDIDDLLNKALNALQSAKVLGHNCYTLLLNTITGSDLSQTTLDSLKSSASSQESSSISGINSVQSTIQNIAGAKINISSSNISEANSLSNSKASLDKAKSNLISAQNNLEQVKRNNIKNITSAQNDVNAKKISYESAQANFNLQTAKPREIDLANLRIQLSQAQNNYDEALKNLKETEIKAPFDGIISKVYQNQNDLASPTNPILTLSTEKKLAIITLNEVDAAKIKVGQKANIFFSAIEDLEITGSVAEIDGLGTLSQSVVTYGVKIVFDVQDERIKPQMSVSVSITTDQKLDVLTVINSAIKQDTNGKSFVEILNQPQAIAGKSENEVTSLKAPEKKNVEIGLSDDSKTEIINGLKEGDKVIISTINPTVVKPTTTSGLNLFGGGGTRMR